MSLWPRNRPLNQPPHAGRVGMQDAPTKTCPVNAAADATIRTAQWDREQKTRRIGAKATVR